MRRQSFIKMVTMSLMTLVMLGTSTTVCAQKKKAPARKTAAKKVTPKEEPVMLPGLIFEDGHLLIEQVSLGLSEADIKKALTEKGFKNDENGNFCGPVNGKQSMIFITDNGADQGKTVTATEMKTYKLAQARQRVTALSKALEKTHFKNLLSRGEWSSEMGEYYITTMCGTIKVEYHDADEVDFTGTAYVVSIQYQDNQF